MRQSHQKSRSRGRGRKPQNPMSRNYESNGPDVKIRGNAGHIAEKYSSLARDALSNGDTVMAENYFQHAEHYNRIIAAAQAATQQAREEQQRAQDEEGGDGGRDGRQLNGRNGSGEDEINGDEFSTASRDGEEEAGARPSRRPRRNQSRSRDGDDGEHAASADVSNGDGQQDEEEPPKPPTRQRRTRRAPKRDDTNAPVEAVSDDAAKLPDSITGGLMAEEG